MQIKADALKRFGLGPICKVWYTYNNSAREFRAAELIQHKVFRQNKSLSIVGRLKPNCGGTNDLSESYQLMAAQDQVAVDGAPFESSVLRRGPTSSCKVSG